jgi:hypothetical protein
MRHFLQRFVSNTRIGSKTPEIMLIIVVLPLPDGQTMNSNSPQRAENPAPYAAVVLVYPSPNHFIKLVATIMSPDCPPLSPSGFRSGANSEP